MISSRWPTESICSMIWYINTAFAQHFLLKKSHSSSQDWSCAECVEWLKIYPLKLKVHCFKAQWVFLWNKIAECVWTFLLSHYPSTAVKSCWFSFLNRHEIDHFFPISIIISWFGASLMVPVFQNHMQCRGRDRPVVQEDPTYTRLQSSCTTATGPQTLELVLPARRSCSEKPTHNKWPLPYHVKAHCSQKWINKLKQIILPVLTLNPLTRTTAIN